MGVGDEVKFFNGTIKFLKISINKENNYQNIKGTFEYKNLQNKDILFEPEIRVYDSPETITYEASIKSTIFSDTYVTMSNISRSELYNIKFQKKPFMTLIWFSTILIVIGGFMRVVKKNF